MDSAVQKMIRRHRLGERVGITSICSAHDLVIEAAARQSQQDGTPLLLEATCNQVNQDGGYTGMTPAGFAARAAELTTAAGLPRDRLQLGGDHLGPYPWRTLPAAESMAKAATLVEDYVAAGFTKVHLDCSMPCADERSLVPEEIARRAAQLVSVAEATAADHADRLSYVIGTEVPTPGGGTELDALEPTPAAEARATLEEHRRQFTAHGVEAAWDRVVALVVQPGVEFDQETVVAYDPARVAEAGLGEVVEDYPHLVFEAHSTDYQTQEALAALVRDHWAILKVGPALTFAFREAVFALGTIEEELIPHEDRAHVRAALEAAMVSDPRWWQDHYTGTATGRAYARAFSLSDRARYYWTVPAVQAAVTHLFDNLDEIGIPGPLLSQYLPRQHTRVADHVLEPTARALVVDRIRDVLRTYAAATGPGREAER